MERAKRHPFSKRDETIANRFGGSDKDSWQDYIQPTGELSPDKGGHRMRSLVTQPNHIIFWRKHEKTTG